MTPSSLTTRPGGGGEDGGDGGGDGGCVKGYPGWAGTSTGVFSTASGAGPTPALSPLTAVAAGGRAGSPPGGGGTVGRAEAEILVSQGSAMIHRRADTHPPPGSSDVGFRPPAGSGHAASAPACSKGGIQTAVTGTEFAEDSHPVTKIDTQVWIPILFVLPITP